MWQVVAITNTGEARQVRIRRGKFTTGKRGRKRMSKGASIRANRWAKQRGWTTHRTRSRYPFLVLDSDTRWPRRKPTKRLNKAARLTGHFFFINEGWRTRQRQQWLWDHLPRGQAAYPGTSRHETGNAIDVQVITAGRTGQRVNIGEHAKARSIATRLGFRWTVNGEPWHIALVGK